MSSCRRLHAQALLLHCYRKAVKARHHDITAASKRSTTRRPRAQPKLQQSCKHRAKSRPPLHRFARPNSSCKLPMQKLVRAKASSASIDASTATALCIQSQLRRSYTSGTYRTYLHQSAIAKRVTLATAKVIKSGAGRSNLSTPQCDSRWEETRTRSLPQLQYSYQQAMRCCVKEAGMPSQHTAQHRSHGENV